MERESGTAKIHHNIDLINGTATHCTVINLGVWSPINETRETWKGGQKHPGLDSPVLDKKSYGKLWICPIRNQNLPWL